jgi:hypothetical protein
MIHYNLGLQKRKLKTIKASLSLLDFFLRVYFVLIKKIKIQRKRIIHGEAIRN